MSPSSKVNRRQWFAGIIATIAAILTPKPKLDLSRAAFQPAPGQAYADLRRVLNTYDPELGQPRQAYATAHLEGGHVFYDIWPQPTPTTAIFMDGDGNLWEFTGEQMRLWTSQHPALNFHRDAFTLNSPPLEKDDVDAAFESVNQMIDRWNTEPLFPRVEHTARIQS